MAETSIDRINAALRATISECLSIGAANPEDWADGKGLGPQEFFFSPEAEELKAEMIRAGRKLWQRQYVDGNGGNLSVRVAGDCAICTPTLCSKGDLATEDFALVDLENRQLCGIREQTSEILLHLEIYKAQPAARAVIHCHPPYATAHAMAGVVPPGDLIPEQEVFVGPVALASYETPGTMAFAKTVLPYVKNHNTILLQNHGIVCWADTIAHAEWYVEVVENYCKTVSIASNIKDPLPRIPKAKITELLQRKQRMGLPDPRLAAMKESTTTPRSGNSSGKGSEAGQKAGGQGVQAGPTASEKQIDRLTASFRAQLLAALKSGALKSGL